MVILVAGALIFGCGDKADKDREGDAAFRVPDTLLARIENFKLTQDEYHPIDGGKMANRNIELIYPASNVARFVAVKTFDLAFDSYRDISREVGAPAAGKIVLIGTKDLDEYKFLTRKEWWYYGVVQGDTIIFEPYDILLRRTEKQTKRSMAEIGIRQKIAQMALARVSGGRIPVWMKESIASYLAREEVVLAIQVFQFEEQLAGFDPTYEELERYLLTAEDMAITRVSFYYAYLMLENLLQTASLPEILLFVKKLGEGQTRDQASREVFGMDYGGLIEKIRVREDIFTSARKVLN